MRSALHACLGAGLFVRSVGKFQTGEHIACCGAERAFSKPQRFEAADSQCSVLDRSSPVSPGSIASSRSTSGGGEGWIKRSQDSAISSQVRFSDSLRVKFGKSVASHRIRRLSARDPTHGRNFFRQNFLAKFSAGNFLRRSIGALRPDSTPRVRHAAERALPSLIRFGEDFQARPAFEAGYIGIALDPDAAELHWILACRAERRISTQRVVVFHDRADFRKQNRRRHYEVDRAFCNCGKLRMVLVAVALAAAATMQSARIASRAQFLTSHRPLERFQRADTVTNTEGAKSLKMTRGEDAGSRSFPERPSASRGGEKGRKRKEPRASEALSRGQKRIVG